MKADAPSDRPIRSKGLCFTHSFRVSESVEEEFQKQLLDSGYTVSQWMREAVMKNQTKVVARPRKSFDSTRILFLVNKASNNLNQIAHTANTARLANRIDAVLYRSVLDELNYISSLLNQSIDHVD